MHTPLPSPDHVSTFGSWQGLRTELDAAGAHGIGGAEAQNQGKQWQADHVAAVQTNGLRVGGVLQL